jgi:hypothetical protein
MRIQQLAILFFFLFIHNFSPHPSSYFSVSVNGSSGIYTERPCFARPAFGLFYQKMYCVARAA